MATPAPFVCYVEQRQAPSRRTGSESRRAAVATGLIAAAICGAVLVVFAPASGVSTAQKASSAQAAAAPTMALKRAAQLAPKDSHLALELIKAAPTQSLDVMHKMVRHWEDRMVSSDDNDVSLHSQSMLVGVPRSITQALQAAGNICAKKDLIFKKFDALLEKLGAESFNRNQTDAAAEMAKDETMKAWLDAESQYRLQVEKKEEAENGAKFARDRYEKWSMTVQETKDRLAKMQAEYGPEEQSIADQRMLIKEILRMLGIMADQPLDDASKAAGGYTAEKAKPLTLAQVRSKIAELKQEAVAGGPISLKQIQLLQSKLANFAESDEVKTLLNNMLKDLDVREDVIKKAQAETEAELKDHEAKLIEYEKEVVDLSNAADAAAMKASNMDLQRQQLNGKKIDAAETYKNEHAEYVVIAPPADRTIYILKVIMAKINEYCVQGTLSTVSGR